MTTGTKSSKESRYEAIQKRWAEAERGTSGLRSVRIYDFDQLPVAQRKEMLTEPTILTADGEETFMVMTIEDYFARIAPTVNPLRQPEMCRINGKMFREVV